MKPLLPSRWSSGDHRCTVEFEAEVLALMIQMADEAHPMETGAALFGTYSEDQKLARIEGIAPVPPDSKRGRFHFRRGIGGLAAFFRRLFSRTNGRSFYVGEFHSHPGGAASPSSQDDATQFAIAAEPTCQCHAPVLVIVGGRPGARMIGVFVHTRARQRFVLSDDGRTPDEPCA